MVKDFVLHLMILLILSVTVLAQTISHFDSGLDEFKNERYGPALKQFEVACQDNPHSVECRFYYALSLYYTDRLKEARSEFSKIVDDQKGSQWGIAARSYMDAIDMGYFAPLPEKDFDGYINLSYETDDNVAYSPFLIAAKADNKSSALLSVSYDPLIFSLRPLSFSCNLYGLIYDKNTNYNLDGGSSDVLFRLPLPMNSYATFSYGSGNYFLKNESYYSADYLDARYTINLPAGSQSWTSIYAGGTNSVYKIASYEGYDGYESRVGIRHDLNAMTYIQYDLKLLDTRSSNFANIANEISLGETFYFPFFHRLYTVIRYTNKPFKYDDSIANDLRHDTSFGIDIFIAKDITRYINLGIKYVYTNNTSNLENTNTALGYGSYIDHVLSLSISYKF